MENAKFNCTIWKLKAVENPKNETHSICVSTSARGASCSEKTLPLPTVLTFTSELLLLSNSMSLSSTAEN